MKRNKLTIIMFCTAIVSAAIVLLIGDVSMLSRGLALFGAVGSSIGLGMSIRAREISTV